MALPIADVGTHATTRESTGTPMRPSRRLGLQHAISDEGDRAPFRYDPRALYLVRKQGNLRLQVTNGNPVTLSRLSEV